MVLALGLTVTGCAKLHQPTELKGLVPTTPTAATRPQAAPHGPFPAVAAAPAPSTVADLVETVSPAVVNITAFHRVSARSGGLGPFPFGLLPRVPGERARPRAFPPRKAAGSGFIIGTQGYVVTNEHVVHGAEKVQIRLQDDRQFDATVVGRDEQLDLALLKIKGASGLPTVALGSEEALRVGENVVAVGNPFGLGHTVTMGIVSAKSRSIGAGPYDDFIQTDAAINPGNSGGPLFNLRGEVIGINTAIRGGAEGIGFAIPVDALKDIMPQLRDKGYVERGKLGLAFQPITSSLAKALGLDRPHGALVNTVQTDSAADKAGIKPGDVIVGIGNTLIRRASELPRNVARHAPGSSINVVVLRNGQRLTLTATLDKLEGKSSSRPPNTATTPESSTGELLGLEVTDHAKGGVRVMAVRSSQANGLQPGDIIVQVGQKPVRNVKQLGQVIGVASPGTTLLFKVHRKGHDYFVGVPITGQ